MFDDKIAELNRQTELHPPTFEKRTYTVSEIQDSRTIKEGQRKRPAKYI